MNNIMHCSSHSKKLPKEFQNPSQIVMKLYAVVLLLLAILASAICQPATGKDVKKPVESPPVKDKVNKTSHWGM
ncbi:hypothetical protein GPALN_011731 [Globodera pallida]|nr:hypothetical protein GPALN_011731 [Globodera pallida]